MSIAASFLNQRVPPASNTLVEPRHLARLRRLGGTVFQPGVLFVPRTGAEGFDVTLYAAPGRITAKLGGLLQDFESIDAALDWAEKCHAPDYRLRVDYIGDRPYQWTLERKLPRGGVVETMASGHPVIFPWFRRKHSRYYWNDGTRTPRHVAIVGARPG